MQKTSRQERRIKTDKNHIGPFVLFALAGIGVIFGLILSTTPDRIGPLGITLFFLTLLLTLVSIGMIIRGTFLRQPSSSSLLLVIISSIAVAGALALNTIELGIGDVILLILFVITFTIYWAKLR